MRRMVVLSLAALFVVAPTDGSVSADGIGVTVPPSHESSLDDALDLPTSSELGAEALFGDRLAEVWIDRSVAPSVLRVSIARPTADDAEALAARSGGNPRVTLREASYSAKQLHDWMASIDQVLARHGAQAAAYEPQPRDGLLVVETREAVPEAAKAEILSVVPPSAVRFAPASRLEPVHTTRADYPPYDAGLRLTTPMPKDTPSLVVASTKFCTSGFTVQDTSGLYYGTTAGHCAQNGQPVYVGPRYVSDVQANTYFSDFSGFYVTSDVLRFPISPVHASPLVTVGGGSHRIVRGKFSDADLGIGTRLCFQGIASENNNCGFLFMVKYGVDIMNETWMSADRRLTKVFCVDFPALKGDSGGPVYQVNADGTAKAAGFVSLGGNITEVGHPFEPEPPEEAVPAMCFTSVQQMETRHPVSVLQG